MEDSERAEYWKGAYERMAARNAEQGLLIAELDAEIRELRTGAYLVKVIEERDRYRKALEGITRRYVELAGSGDCGFWDPESEDEVIAARAALESTNEPT